VFDLQRVGKLKREDTIFIVDASQSVPHMKVDVQIIDCDFLFFTGHKVFADSGIGVLW
jgi:cysteine desulfurase / selenocysteine lyase